MGNESSTEVVQDEAKFLEGLQGMCVSLPWLLGREIVCVACMFVLVRRSYIYLLRLFVMPHSLIILWTAVWWDIARSS